MPTPPPHPPSFFPPPPRLQSTTICLLNKQVSRVLLQNQTFMTTVRSEYCVPDGTPSGALSPSSLAGLSMPRDKVHAFARVRATCNPRLQRTTNPWLGWHARR